MDIIYTLHALERIHKRKIHQVWVEEAIKYPDIIQIFGNKYLATKQLINNSAITVVYIKEKYIKIITIYWNKDESKI